MTDRRRNLSKRTAPSPPPEPGPPDEPSDAELVRRLADADGAALSELYQRFGRLSYSLARRICSDDGLAEDVVHAVFMTMWREPARIDPARRGLATWLLTTTHEKAVTMARQDGTARRRSAAPEPGQEWAPTPLVGPDRTAVPGAATGQVRAALDQLPDEQRQVLTKTYFGGYTLREIAARTGVPLDTVTSRLYAGVQQLRALLAERRGPDALAAEARAVWKVSR